MIRRWETAPPALARKLRVRKPGGRAAVIGAPAGGYLERLDPPSGANVRQTLDGPLDWIQVFVRSSAELAAIVPGLTAALDPEGMVWISYPKGSSKLQTDLTRDKGWEPIEGRPDVALPRLDRRRLVGLQPAALPTRRGPPDIPLTATRSLG